MFPHVGRQVRGHLLQLRGDNQSPRLEQGSSVLASGVERSHPGSREGVGMNLGLPQDGYRTIGLGGAERFDVDLGSVVNMLTTRLVQSTTRRSMWVTSATAGGATKLPCRMYMSTARGSCRYRIINLCRSLSATPRCTPKGPPGGAAWGVHMGTHMGP